MATKRRKKPTPPKAVRKREMKFGSLQVSWLIAFVETADSKRTAAAEMLGVTQSAVTKYIDSLESWYGGGPSMLLMIPNVYPTVLTPAGEEFLPKARELLELLRVARPEPAVVGVLQTERYGPPLPTKFMKIPGGRDGWTGSAEV